MALFSALQKFITKDGQPVEGASVLVYLAGSTTPATLYATRDGGAKSNPFLTLANGNALCYVAPGRYDMLVTKDADQVTFSDMEVGPVSMVGTFAGGGVITDPDQLVEDAAGNKWRWDGALNYVFVPGEDPEAVVGWVKWVSGPGVDVAAFEQELAAVDSTTLVGGVPAGDITKRLSGEISVMEFGAAGDGITDDTAALNTAFEFGRVNNLKVTAPPLTTFRVADTVVINCNADLSSSKFTCPSSFDKPLIRTSASLLGVNLVEFRQIKYPDLYNDRFTVNGAGSAFTAGSIGIKIDGHINADFHYGEVYGFEIGIQHYSNDAASYVAYNNNYYGKMAANKTNVQMIGEGTGWVNESIHYGGQWARFSGDDAVGPITNLSMVKTAVGGNNPPNGHTFIGCSMEGAFTGGTIVQDYAGSTSFSCCNSWVGCRFEGGSFFTFSPIALGQTFLGCWGDSLPSFTAGVRPQSIGFRSFNFKNDSAPAAGGASVRRDKFIPLFDVTNTGSAVGVGVGFTGRLNAAMTGNGAFESYNNGDESLLHPVVRNGFEGGRATLNMGFGSVAPDNWIKLFGNLDMRHNTVFSPFTDNSQNMGASTRRYLNNYSVNFRPGTGAATWTSGTGSPEGAVTASVGSMYTRTDGGAGTTLYVKESGTGATGWVAK